MINWSVVFFDDGPMVSAVRGFNVNCFIVPTGRLRQPHRMAGAIWRLRNHIRQTKADVVLSWMTKAQIYGGTAAALARVPTVWFQHGLSHPPSFQDRWATALPARSVLACSIATATAQMNIWPHRSSNVIYPGVDLAKFDPASLPSPAECRRNLSLPQSGPLIGIVGRLQQWKGIHHLIDAMPAILKAYPAAHAVVVGGSHAFEPHYPSQLQSQINGLGLSDRIILAGLQQNVPEWMQAMDVIVHASDNEPFGIVVIEAMAMGKPVVASGRAGPTEIITHELNGLLWKVARPANLAECILRYLDNPNWAKKVGAKATARAADFAVQRYAERIAQSILNIVIG